jgi:SAM-dependent methyltransferase
MTQNVIKNWWGKDTDFEALMEDEHTPQWLDMIRLMAEDDIADKSILDFGCNQGGFLRLLYAKKPFKSAVGADIAADTIAAAAEKAAHLPATFIATADISNENLNDQFDLAFSNEVVYLLPDLKKHAADIWGCLKPGGVYYLSISSHTDNPMWPRWRELIAADSALDVQDYSLTDISDAMNEQGFAVAAQPFKTDGFLPVSRSNDWFRTPYEVFEYHYRQKVLFRIEKPTV